MGWSGDGSEHRMSFARSRSRRIGTLKTWSGELRHHIVSFEISLFALVDFSKILSFFSR